MPSPSYEPPSNASTTPMAPDRHHHPAGPTDRVLVEVPRWMAAVADRGIQAIIVLVAVAASGFVAVGLAWSGVAARLDVGLQLPFVVSGAFGGVAVTAAFLAIAGTQVDRRHRATERFQTDAAVCDIAHIADRLPTVVARRARTTRAAVTAAPALGPALVHNGRTVHAADCRMAAGRDLPLLEPGDVGALRACRICRPL
jgi:hypothetical protein